ncbi:Holliday junction ATP-dependent DNA helicase RuvA [bioreactor metagenome]|uniref:Holliday junction ATP-dependent DNA helicase RuvA n=1 Tax=bioreactor metagenome TaxID=1076179 RepID=A0A644UAK5_9ZZZZ|nr:Holliday junction branch migration protein RuvA [Candidatus Elulimicrobiales bacterium]
MIGFLNGTIIEINEKSLTLLTSSGVGYKVFTTLNTLLSKNEKDALEVFIYTVVKDDAIDLYGFVEKEELQMFEKLITVSGIGPRSALNILSVSNVNNIALAVENGEASLLSGIPGLGKRSCEKIVIELKGKLSHFIKAEMTTEDASEENDAKLALISLGYNEKDVNNAIKDIKQNNAQIFNNMQASEIIREILKDLR